MTSPTKLRAAGLLERYHITRHFLHLDSSVVVSARYTCTDGSLLTKEILFPALRKVIEKHPVLAVKLQEEDVNPSFVRLAKIELPLVTQFSDDDDLELAIKRHLSKRFDTHAELPLWRVEILKDGTVIFAFHHGICDGLSGVTFHSSLLTALQDVITVEISVLVEVPDTLSLLPPIEVATSLRPSLRKIITEIFSLLAPASWTRGYSAWTANPVSKNIQLDPRVKLFTFTNTEMTAFSAACRSHGATITSAFYCLAVATISRLIPPASQQYKTLSAFVPVNLRGVAGVAADTMCDYVSAHHTYPPLNPTFEWPTAARYASELQRQKHAAREEIGMLSFLFGNYAGFLRGQLGRKRVGTFEISNAGRVCMPTIDGSWHIENMAFAQCNVILGSALTLSVIGDPTGATTVALTSGEDAIDGMLVESFVTDFKDAFRALLV
ncbi:alcohol acetyltransferase [Mycena pura]|uniref:Alcohol acetyltransferase n=1 Tax=Mycena pura TaxID=153505 RepID=A0AAD6YS28_9AGAR|nr:alcohol acetyltransferase [Mycena pura]